MLPNTIRTIRTDRTNKTEVLCTCGSGKKYKNCCGKNA
ncbi:MAG: SEC-C domain-containing protein [Clostridia bacterium]|nr:SEC-C domain-containing protein [Clostridia bacterium]